MVDNLQVPDNGHGSLHQVINSMQKFVNQGLKLMHYWVKFFNGEEE